jgi:hypothetical protein
MISDKIFVGMPIIFVDGTQDALEMEIVHFWGGDDGLDNVVFAFDGPENVDPGSMSVLERSQDPDVYWLHGDLFKVEGWTEFDPTKTQRRILKFVDEDADES